MSTTAQRWRLPDQAASCSFIARYGSTTALLPPSAGAQIEEVLLATTSIDGLETGGVLGGSSRRDCVVARAVSGPGPSSVRSASSYLCDADFDWDRIDRWRSAGIEPVGCWHWQPHLDGEPSARDLTTWSKRRRLLGAGPTRLARYLAIVVTGSMDGWFVNGYMIRSGAGTGPDICERAIVR
jgi:integrative and conjugative element protein (TIGR02256 family)